MHAGRGPGVRAVYDRESDVGAGRLLDVLCAPPQLHALVASSGTVPGMGGRAGFMDLDEHCRVTTRSDSRRGGSSATGACPVAGTVL